MEDSIKASCPECGKEFDIPAAHIGKKAKCSKCSKIFTVTLPVTTETSINSDASQPEPQEGSSNSESKRPATKAEIPRKDATDRKKELEHVAKLLKTEEQKSYSGWPPMPTDDKKPQTTTEKLANFFILIGVIEIIVGIFCLTNGAGAEDGSLIIIGGVLLGNSLGLFAVAAILFSLSTIVVEIKKLTKRFC